jgi:methylmalonyl-CoA mutase cobalamin-binding subunit
MLTRDDIQGLLHELAEELQRRGITAEVFLVGGAAMVLAYDRERATRDLDAIFEPKAAVYDAARAVAVRHDLLRTGSTMR